MIKLLTETTVNKTILTLLAAAVGAVTASATDISGLQPGELSSRLGESATEVTSLKLSGTIDARDLATVASLPVLTELDLSDVDIAAFTAYTPLSLSETDFAADYLPAGLFFCKHLELLSLPGSLKEIGSHALAGNDFVTLQIPDGLTTIGDYAFYDCDKLTSVTLPASVTSIGNYLFAGCDAIKSVDMSAISLDVLPEYTFRNAAALEEVKLPSSLKEIGQGAFVGCRSLAGASLPSSLSEIGEQAFSHSALATAEIPASVGKVGDFAFARCESMTKATLADSDTELGDGVFFYATSLKDFETDGLTALPDFTFTGDKALSFASSSKMSDLTRVGAYALMDNNAEKMILSPTLIYLDKGAMEGMTSLKEIDASALGDRVPELGENVFAGITQSEVTLTVATDMGDVWRAAPQWNEFTINAPSGVDGIAAGASSSVKTWFEGMVMQISAPSDIESVSVYLSGGAKVVYSEPYSPNASIDTSDFSDRIYIVEVITSEGRNVFKLLR